MSGLCTSTDLAQLKESFLYRFIIEYFPGGVFMDAHNLFKREEIFNSSFYCKLYA